MHHHCTTFMGPLHQWSRKYTTHLELIASGGEMSDLMIRDAQPGEGEAILALTLAAYEQYAPIIGEPGWQMYRSDIVKTLAEAAGTIQLIAELDGKRVGAVMLIPAGTVIERVNEDSIPRNFPEIRLLAVPPVSRGHGVGKALVQECIRRGREAGATVLTLYSTDMMQVAMHMYERMGFARDAEMDFHPVPEVTIKGYRLQL